MENENPCEAVGNHSEVVRSYSGIFEERPDFTPEPDGETYSIGYWSLKITDMESEKGSFRYVEVALASYRHIGVMRSSFRETYHSNTTHHRKGLDRVPTAILDSISWATGEEILFE